MGASGGRSLRIESVLVGVFGAVIGGEILASMLSGAPAVVAVKSSIPGVKAEVAATPFSVLAMVLAIAGAVAAVLVLGLMRKAVGPLRIGKKKNASGR